MTFVSVAKTADWTNFGVAKTVSGVSVVTGDVIVVIAGSSTADCSYLTPDDGVNTYNLEEEALGQATQGHDVIWTATAASSTSLDIDLFGDNDPFGFIVAVFRDVTIGASSQGAAFFTAPSWSLVTTADGSTIVALMTDWDSTDGSTRVYRTIDSITPVKDTASELLSQPDTFLSAFAGMWEGIGAAGSKTVGMSAPTMRWSGVALELVDAGGGGSEVSTSVDIEYNVATSANITKRTSEFLMFPA